MSATIKSCRNREYRAVVYWQNGARRSRKYFKTGKDAKDFASRMDRQVHGVGPGEDAVSAAELRAIGYCRQHGIDMMNAATHWQNTAAKAKGKTLAELITARLEASGRHKLSKRYKKELELVLGGISKKIGHLHASEIEPENLSGVIFADGAPRTQAKRRRLLIGVFRHAQRCGVMKTNPAQLTEAPRDTAAAEIQILSPAHAREWLQTVLEVSPGILPGVAIGLYAGLRAAEIERLDWKQVRLDRGHIEVTAGKSKTRTRRLVPVLGCLRNILGWNAQTEGRVWHSNGKKLMDRARAAHCRKVPPNAARHSFVSYRLALTGDAAKTALEAGHDQAILFRHYRELVTKEEAEDYFSGIYPTA